LIDTKLDALPRQPVNLVPPVLAHQLTHRQYLYDPLGQLIALRTPAQTLRYGYDAAGRLRAQADSLTPEITQRWDVDPAGNRLSRQMPTPQQQRDWADLLQSRWRDPAFNLLTQDATPAQQQGPIDKWLGNRVGFYQGCAWGYDAQGNRVEQMLQAAKGYNRQRLFYDGANQLAALHVESTDAQGNATALSQSRYTYDALGRRLKKTVKHQKQERITYYGWDNDRLVHTEQMKEDGTRDIVHTIYEPNSFTPLIRLSTTAQGAPQAKPHLMVQAIKAAMPKDQRNQLGLDQTLAMTQNIITDLPELMQKKLDETLRQVFQSSVTGTGDAMSGISKVNRTNELMVNISKKIEESLQKRTGLQEALPGTTQTCDLVKNMREGLEEIRREEQGPITIHYYFCNHLGIPLALIDQQGNIVWAAKLDPWGNMEEEFNPQPIDQPIRLPGQYHDQETGLHYNIDKYYDPQIGAYINQNPNDANQVNRYRYSLSLAAATNPLGFLDLSFLPEDSSSNILEPKKIADFNLYNFIKTLCRIDEIGTVRRLFVSSGGTKRML
jgi:RHS repeat-associated protein